MCIDMADLIKTTKSVLKHVVETRSLPDVDLLKLLISQVSPTTAFEPNVMPYLSLSEALKAE